MHLSSTACFQVAITAPSQHKYKLIIKFYNGVFGLSLNCHLKQTAVVCSFFNFFLVYLYKIFHKFVRFYNLNINIMLEKELSLFNKVNAELQSQYPQGGFVVIKDEEILGVWSSRIDALRAGIDKYGDVEFLVKNIFDSDVVVNFTRNLMFA